MGVDNILLTDFKSADNKEIKALHVESLNPVSEIIRWTKENNYTWLSLPNAYEFLDWSGLQRMAMECKDISAKYKDGRNHGLNKNLIQAKSRNPDLLRVECDLLLNTYFITQRHIDWKKQIENNEEWLTVYIGHNMNKAFEELSKKYSSSLVMQISEHELKGLNKTNVSRCFKLESFDGIGWIQTFLNAENTSLKNGLFGYKTFEKDDFTTLGRSSSVNLSLPGAGYNVTVANVSSKYEYISIYGYVFFNAESKDVDKISIAPVVKNI